MLLKEEGDVKTNQPHFVCQDAPSLLRPTKDKPLDTFHLVVAQLSAALERRDVELAVVVSPSHSLQKEMSTSPRQRDKKKAHKDIALDVRANQLPHHFKERGGGGGGEAKLAHLNRKRNIYEWEGKGGWDRVTCAASLSASDGGFSRARKSSMAVRLERVTSLLLSHVHSS
jgi:hypothetical protein